MSDYTKILVAVDLTDDSAIVLDKARKLAKLYDAELSLVHVMEPIAVGMAVEVSSVDIESLHEEAAKYARETVQEMGTNIGIPESRLHNLIGQPAREIKDLAKKLASDMVSVGGHGKHGFDLLLGSTSSSIAHGISCDLLIVRMADS